MQFNNFSLSVLVHPHVYPLSNVSQMLTKTDSLMSCIFFTGMKYLVWKPIWSMKRFLCRDMNGFVRIITRGNRDISHFLQGLLLIQRKRRILIIKSNLKRELVGEGSGWSGKTIFALATLWL